MTTPPLIEKLRVDAAAEVARLEEELELVRAAERVFWTDPTDEKSQALAAVRAEDDATIATLAPATEGTIILPSSQRKLQFLEFVTEHPDTTMREYTDSIGAQPTSYYRAAAELVSAGLLIISSAEGQTKTFRARMFRTEP